MGRQAIHLTEKEVNQIHEIQMRVEAERRRVKYSQQMFANKLGVSLNVYKNNVNPSKCPKTLIDSDFLRQVAFVTGKSIEYLKTGATDSGVHNPIRESQESLNQFNDLCHYLSSNYELAKALHFLLLKLPPNHAETFRSQIVSNYKILSEYSFFKYPDVINNSSVSYLHRNGNLQDIVSFNQKLLEVQGDEALSKKRKHQALQLYLRSLLTQIESTGEYTTKKLEDVLFFNSCKNIATKIEALVKAYPQVANSKVLSPTEKSILRDLISRFSK